MRILKDNLVYISKYAEVHSTEYADTKNNVKEWTWVGRPNNVKAISIVPLVEGIIDTICVIKEFRVPLNDYTWAFPAGLIDETKESIDECICRELKEETGLDLVSIYNITPFVYNSPGITNESIAMAFVRAKGVLSNKNLESSEEIEAHLFDRFEVKHLLDTEKNICAKAYIIMKHFAHFNNITI